MVNQVFSSSLRIPVLQRYNQNIVERLSALKLNEASSTFHGLQLYGRAGDLVDSSAVSPRQFISGPWDKLLAGDDTEVESIKLSFSKSDYKDILFSHMLRYAEGFWLLANFCRKSLILNTKCDAAFRTVAWTIDQYGDDLHVPEGLRQTILESVRSYAQNDEKSIAYERCIAALFSNLQIEGLDSVSSLIRSKFQQFIYQDLLPNS